MKKVVVIYEVKLNFDNVVYIGIEVKDLFCEIESNIQRILIIGYVVIIVLGVVGIVIFIVMKLFKGD